MKKIFIGLAVLALSSCYYLKGDYTLGRRNMFNDFFYTYNIRYYDENEFASIDMETEVLSDYQIGDVRHAIPGGKVLSSKVVQREIYSDAFVRPTSKGALVSYTVPVEFSDEKVYKAIGEAEINGVIYRLLEPNRLGDLVLLDEQGRVYQRVGRIYNGRLALLETAFVLEPRELRFKNEVENRIGEERIVSGFEIFYQGIEDYMMVFKYNVISPNGKMSVEQQKTYKFPMYDKIVIIDGVKLEILEATDGGIDYKILEI